MEFRDLIILINNSAEELDFVSTRRYIEDNMEILEGRERLLNSNARELFKFLTKQVEAGYEPISKKDLATINTINSYAYKFDLRGIKLAIKDKMPLFLRDDILTYLNQDAQTILKSMGVIH